MTHRLLVALFVTALPARPPVGRSVQPAEHELGGRLLDPVNVDVPSFSGHVAPPRA